MNEPDVEEVGGQLVGEPWPLARMLAGRGDVRFADRPQLIRAEFRDNVGITAPRSRTFLEPVDHGREVGKLAATADLRMTGENLLDQRRTRARHANDEYRHPRRAPVALRPR